MPLETLKQELGWRVGDRLFGRYVVELRKQGGMASVYVCEDRQTQARVVLKIPLLPIEAILDVAHTFESVVAELAAWLRIRPHPNVVQLLDAKLFQAFVLRPRARHDATDPRGVAGFPCLILQYGGERNLREYVQSAPGWREGGKLHVLKQIALGMQHAASCGVSPHLDLKPDNIILDKDMVARVTDFGLAATITAATPEGSDDPLSTQAVALGEVTTPGTPAYMAPEQWSTSEPCDQRTDIYAFGVMAYEVLTGHHPFASSLTGEVRTLREAHLHEEPSWDKLSRSSPLSGTVRKCLAKRPDARFQNWGELIEHLGGEAQPLPAASDATTARPGPPDQGAITLGMLDPRLRDITESLFRGSSDVYIGKLVAHFTAREWFGALWETLKRMVRLQRVPVKGWLMTALASQMLFVDQPALMLVPLVACLGAFALAVNIGGFPNAFHILGFGILALFPLSLFFWALMVLQARLLKRCVNCGARLTRLDSVLRMLSPTSATASVAGWGLRGIRRCVECGLIEGWYSPHGVLLRATFSVTDTTRMLGMELRLPRWRYSPPWPQELAFGFRASALAGEIRSTPLEKKTQPRTANANRTPAPRQHNSPHKGTTPDRITRGS